MGSLADQIEQHIKKMLAESRQRTIRLNRCQLAEMFNCVPSQINYVLSTRFNPERGYYVESRRGGGGYVLIARLAISDNEGVVELINSIPEQVTERESHDLIQYLYEEDFLTKREAMLMVALTQGSTLMLAAPEANILRANIVRIMLHTILRNDFVD